MELYIDYPHNKGWGLAPYYSGEWEDYAAELGLDPYLEEPEPKSDWVEELETIEGK